MNRRRTVNYVPHVSYGYNVEGREFASERVGVAGPAPHGEYTDVRVRQRMRSEGWQPGEPVTVHYDPLEPSTAAIDVSSDHSESSLQTILFGALGPIGIFFGIRALRSS